VKSRPLEKEGSGAGGVRKRRKVLSRGGGGALINQEGDKDIGEGGAQRNKSSSFGYLELKEEGGGT